MNIIVAMTASAEAESAARTGIDEAALRGADVVLLFENPGNDPEPPATLAAHAEDRGVRLTTATVPEGADFSDALIDISYDEDTAMVVIGLRRRSPVGKLFLGSTSQRILLEAGCPVHAVKVRVGPRR